MVAYRFEIQLFTDVIIEDDSVSPMSKTEARRYVVDNLREYLDKADLSDCSVTDGIELK